MSYATNNHYGAVPPPPDSLTARAHASDHMGNDLAGTPAGNHMHSSPLAQSAGQQNSIFTEDFEASKRASTFTDASPSVVRSASRASTTVGGTPSRNNTLKKKASMKRMSSMKRSASKKSLKAGSIGGLGGRNTEENFHSAFHTPIPTQGTPTEVLAERFQAWRALLKSLITYFREVQASYDARAKATHKVQNTLANIITPAMFSSEHGLSEATHMLESYHQRSLAEANKSRDIEADVIGALSGLRSDLGQKIKEIKSLSGDFKNSVEKEKDTTRREVDRLRDALQHADHGDNGIGKNDPYVVRLGVDRAVEKQIDEENYLHRAYLNLEASGRELESIVVGEIQKAYNALAGILKREGDDAYNAVEKLRSGPISMPKDQEWNNFVINDPHFVDPELPVRRVEDIEYPGRNDPAAAEVRAGMLERKSKYLKSYTPGWYVLSPTHLHEFKSADKIYSQPPVMSLPLADQKLGSKSEAGSSSQKFMLKGRQAGKHKGHNWVFRAESRETMDAWYGDIHTLTEATGEERSAFVRKHARSVSGTSERPTVSSDGIMEEDEADEVPYSADAASFVEQSPSSERQQRPVPGGRFPSDLRIPQTLADAQQLSPSSNNSSDRDAIAAAGALSGSNQHEYENGQDPYRLSGIASHTNQPNGAGDVSPIETQAYALPIQSKQATNQHQSPVGDNQISPSQDRSFLASEPAGTNSAPLAQQAAPSGNSVEPAAVGAVGVGGAAIGAGALAAIAHDEQKKDNAAAQEAQEDLPTPPGAAAIAPAPAKEQSPVSSHPALIGSAAPVAPASPVAAVAPAGPVAGLMAEERSPTGVKTPIAAYPTPAGGNTPIGPLSPPVERSDAMAEQDPVLGGLEKEGAHETGHIFPSVVRHDTDLSIRKLHVPGEFR